MVARDDISNRDAKGGPFKLGKAFMLDDEGHGNWSAVYDLRNLWKSDETPQSEMSYYDRMLAIGQLPMDFSTYPTYRGRTNWAAWDERESRWVDRVSRQAAIDSVSERDQAALAAANRRAQEAMDAAGSRYAADVRRFHENQGRRP